MIVNPPKPEMRNTNGDPMEFHTLIYRIDDAEAAVMALAPLAAADSLEELLADAKRLHLPVESRVMPHTGHALIVGGELSEGDSLGHEPYLTLNPGLVVVGDDFYAENLTIENTSGDHGQAQVEMAERLLKDMDSFFLFRMSEDDALLLRGIVRLTDDDIETIQTMEPHQFLLVLGSGSSRRRFLVLHRITDAELEMVDTDRLDLG
jgi:hypothetical protein